MPLPTTQGTPEGAAPPMPAPDCQGAQPADQSVENYKGELAKIAQQRDKAKGALKALQDQTAQAQAQQTQQLAEAGQWQQVAQALQAQHTAAQQKLAELAPMVDRLRAREESDAQELEQLIASTPQEWRALIPDCGPPGERLRMARGVLAKANIRPGPPVPPGAPPSPISPTPWETLSKDERAERRAKLKPEQRMELLAELQAKAGR